MDTIEKALDTFGEDHQIDKMIEEAAELILALQHYKLNRCLKHDVLSEMADCEIMLEQMKLVFNKRNEFQNEKDRKLQRLDRIITSHIIKGLD